MSQSMEVLELRTFRDLQYVRSMETLMRSLDARLRAADGSVSAKSFQVGPSGLRPDMEGVIAIGLSGSKDKVMSGKKQGLAGLWGPVWVKRQGPGYTKDNGSVVRTGDRSTLAAGAEGQDDRATAPELGPGAV